MHTQIGFKEERHNELCNFHVKFLLQELSTSASGKSLSPGLHPGAHSIHVFLGRVHSIHWIQQGIWGHKWSLFPVSLIILLPLSFLLGEKKVPTAFSFISTNFPSLSKFSTRPCSLTSLLPSPGLAIQICTFRTNATLKTEAKPSKSS